MTTNRNAPHKQTDGEEAACLLANEISPKSDVEVNGGAVAEAATCSTMERAVVTACFAYDANFDLLWQLLQATGDADNIAKKLDETSDLLEELKEEEKNNNEDEVAREAHPCDADNIGKKLDEASELLQELKEELKEGENKDESEVARGGNDSKHSDLELIGELVSTLLDDLNQFIDTYKTVNYQDSYSPAFEITKFRFQQNETGSKKDLMRAAKRLQQLYCISRTACQQEENHQLQEMHTEVNSTMDELGQQIRKFTKDSSAGSKNREDVMDGLNRETEQLLVEDSIPFKGEKDEHEQLVTVRNQLIVEAAISFVNMLRRLVVNLKMKYPDKTPYSSKDF